MKSAVIPALSYHPLEKLPVVRPVDRYGYVKQQCRGLRVLDLGAYDETEVVKTQHESWRWLHAEIASVAKEVLGVDASPALPEAGITTKFGTRIVRGGVEDLSALVRDFKPDIIVAGEIIEHTQDTLGWLQKLANDAPRTKFLATTPNTTSIINLLLAPLGRENNHQDHLHVYSFKTLATLASRVPLQGAQLTPYYYDPHIFRGRLPQAAAPLVSMTDTLMLRPLQWVFPLTAFGWVLEGTFPDR
jgi:hypothetical protein